MSPANRCPASARIVLAALCLSHGLASAAPALPALAADPRGLTVSGVSSGAYLAVQFQVAHSRLVSGAGIIAGGPYGCAGGSIWRALTSCMAPSSWAPLPTVAELRANAEALARGRRIDPLDDLRDDRVWLLSGGRDRTVAPEVVDRLAAFYAEWLPPRSIESLHVADAAHAMISVADPLATACDQLQAPYINRCGDLDAAGQMLAWMLGRLQPRVADPTGETIAFDQRPFVKGKAIDASLADDGYVYVPTVCRSASCRVHVVFHGCRQSAGQIGRRFVDGAGYNNWADHNRLIVLYPQTTARYGPAIGSWKWLSNPFACWDWWGYSGEDYATRDGRQISAVRAMIERLTEPREAPPTR
ncbi:poly(3-hydroxybutyrate) depolymerase [Accumulibacter sp.]|uniref:extracellular catalytic domain type 2 short-chain-length polyhydroxyalkanoate depolymerase n=1 Tax=Accumulibacter sp. TaxID=2053492 RepID=UPI0025E4922F|nr:poly(3-hydroxybutyrate) depolymerase [Accumulibacter sp.]MCM8594795.1 PHB depolymerase family esterase [Accumulibacter sp.]MCM8625100.1 PHB depolymerase family esterase [Accumulibacter sp.]MDS4048940.1 poly(3-hydroxybutyrate) depolymerase [Accumulibacter sp.]